MADDSVLELFALGFPWATIDPFLFCVHHEDHYPRGNDALGPDASLAGRRIGQDFEGQDGWRMYHGDVVPGFPQHPHRGFETVTVARRGFIDHSDSLGAAARFGQGDAQWLTAGGGIVHSEMFPLLDGDGPNPLELFQIWLNLPRADKMAEPHFAILWHETIPTHRFEDAAGRSTRVTTVAGALEGQAPPPPPPHSWATREDAHVAIWTIRMDAGARWTLPAADPSAERCLYFFAGEGMRVGEHALEAPRGARLRPGAAIELEAGDAPCELLLLQGRPIGEPVAHHGPFVMNDRAGLQQAFVDYQKTRFGGWPWESDGPVHGREGRFARHIDGTLERPD
ncbi:MAG TPA: pirin family protein [Polyangiaceae bacterium LLY-WYZ-15_(1-7)]|nr:pirin [Myxococcales bacterium]MAT26528.1 pirin [Sandaracinus sp.]HJK89852.1 pirin family protein [Polyangiaceae bacterium LLY-WYZ-15_(1-7)]MBJ71016.1 pirin [Sandaracinus sp.]HJL02489.1 pirin family protein [Polyangiaceae bacterium LLY-WYZ-15_(1-7)]